MVLSGTGDGRAHVDLLSDIKLFDIEPLKPLWGWMRLGVGYGF